MGKRQLNRRQGRPDEEYCDDRLHHHKSYDEEDVVTELPRTDGQENPNHTDGDDVGDPGVVGFGNGDSKIKDGRRLTPNDSADMFVKTVGAPFPSECRRHVCLLPLLSNPTVSSFSQRSNPHPMDRARTFSQSATLPSGSSSSRSSRTSRSSPTRIPKPTAGKARKRSSCSSRWVYGPRTGKEARRR